MPYNITNLTRIRGLYDILAYTQNVTNDWFIAIIIVSIFIIVIMNQRQYGIDKAGAAASFVCLILSIFMASIGLLNITFSIFFVIALAASMLHMTFNEY